MLPVELPPVDGEALPGYLARLALVLDEAPRRLYNHLGLCMAGHTPAYLPLILDDLTRMRLQDTLEVDTGQLTAMLLEAYHGLDLSMLHPPATRGAHRNAQRAQWLFMSGTRLCAMCVQDGLPWQNYWQLPWAFACGRHHVLLTDTCAACARRPDLLARHASETRNSTFTSCACGARWGIDDTPAPLSTDQLELQRTLLDASRGDTAELWGEPTSGQIRLSAWRAAGALWAAPHPEGSWARPLRVRMS